MKKLDFFLVMSLFLLVISVQFAFAAPPWKRDTSTTKPSTTTSTATSTQPQIVEKVIIQNNTIVQQPSQKGGINWEMIGVITAIVGVVVGWLISRKVRGKTATYMSEIDKVYGSYSKNSNKCEAELANLREKIESDFKKGKINDQSLALLEARIDKYSEKLRTEIIDKGFKLPPDLSRKIKHMLSDGIITKEEHEHFLEALKEGHDLSKADEERLKDLMKRWKKEDRR